MLRRDTTTCPARHPQELINDGLKARFCRRTEVDSKCLWRGRRAGQSVRRVGNDPRSRDQMILKIAVLESSFLNEQYAITINLHCKSQLHLLQIIVISLSKMVLIIWRADWHFRLSPAQAFPFCKMNLVGVANVTLSTWVCQGPSILRTYRLV